MAIEFEEVDTPPIINIASSSANSEEQTAPEKSIKNEKIQHPTIEPFEGKSATPGKTPKRVLERKRVATKRFGIDVMQVEKEDGN